MASRWFNMSRRGGGRIDVMVRALTDNYPDCRVVPLDDRLLFESPYQLPGYEDHLLLSVTKSPIIIYDGKMLFDWFRDELGGGVSQFAALFVGMEPTRVRRDGTVYRRVSSVDTLTKSVADYLKSIDRALSKVG